MGYKKGIITGVDLKEEIIDVIKPRTDENIVWDPGSGTIMCKKALSFCREKRGLFFIGLKVPVVAK